MRLSKFAYYGDFFVYPLVVALLAAVAARQTGPGLFTWFLALAGGVLLWTVLEYLIHRLFLHAIGPFVAVHHQHHAAPREYIGTPWWISVAVLSAGVGLPAWLAGGPDVASGITAGVMLGYWWYGIVHHVIHHRTRIPLAGHFHARRLHHLRHHHGPARGNFGVTTTLWDSVLGTRID